MNRGTQIVLPLLLAGISAVIIFFPLQIRELMARWTRYWEYEEPRPEWYTQKWTPNYIRAFGFLILILAGFMLFLMTRK